MKLLHLGILSVAVVVLASCASKMEGLTKSPDFNYSNLSSGKVLVAGVVASGSRKLNLAQAVQYGDLLTGQLREERRKLAFAGPGILSERIGPEKYAALLEQYRTTGAVSMPELRTALGNAFRFVAFARVDSDTTRKSQSETAPRTFKHNGRTQREPGFTEKEHSRAMSATIHVYDLRKGELAFSGQVSKEQSNSRRYDNNSVREVVTFISAVQGKKDALSPHPEAPPRELILKSIFEGFGENFPNE